MPSARGHASASLVITTVVGPWSEKDLALQAILGPRPQGTYPDQRCQRRPAMREHVFDFASTAWVQARDMPRRPDRRQPQLTPAMATWVRSPDRLRMMSAMCRR